MKKSKKRVKSAIQSVEQRVASAAKRVLRRSLDKRPAVGQALAQTRDEIAGAVDRIEEKVDQAVVGALDLVRTAASDIAPLAPSRQKAPSIPKV
jgi:hypothetical protein